MQRDFSLLNTTQHYDVLICGGGIYGAWTAYDAALRGLKVAIVDQGDWAGATSSASSKLIHGGLRYLQTLDFGLVRKALAERQMLMQTAPHRIWPLRFGIPVYQNNRMGSWQLKIGLTLYDFLAQKLPADHSHCHHSHDDFSSLYPCINTTSLNCGYSYTDAQTDDARLVLELIDGALSAGAVCLNYCKVNNLVENNGRVCGAEIQDLLSSETKHIYADQTVNTIGQWMNTTPGSPDYCRLSKGIHLILPKVLGKQALLLTAKADGRVFFIIPWYGLTLIGTTDTNFQGDINQVTVEQQDIDYLLNETNRVLKTVNWTQQDVIGQFVGLRVLKQSKKITPNAVSRDWQLKKLRNGLLVSIGGKITSAREDAACIVDTLCKNSDIDQICKTYGKTFPWKPEANYQHWLITVAAEAKILGIDNESTLWLLRRHGKRVPRVFNIIANKPQFAERITPELPFIFADLMFCAEHEMVVHLEDLIRRRLPLLILKKMHNRELQRIAELVAPILNWDNTRMNNELAECQQKWLIP